MQSKYDISFIILTWNSANYINQCLTSIDEIRQFKVKIYVIDNGSTDETQRLLKNWQAKVHRAELESDFFIH